MKPETEPTGHERKDADVISLFLIGILLFLICIIAVLTCWGLMHVFTLHRYASTKPPRQMSPEERKFPEPKLLVQPSGDLKQFRAQEANELQTYGWINRSAGTVRIPIDRAMQLLVQRGLPDVGQNMTPLQLMQERPEANETPTATPQGP